MQIHASLMLKDAGDRILCRAQWIGVSINQDATLAVMHAYNKAQIQNDHLL